RQRRAGPASLTHRWHARHARPHDPGIPPGRYLLTSSRGHTETQAAVRRPSGHGHPRTHDPMNALTLTLIRLAFLAVLWLFVIAAVGVVRTDLFGQAVSARQQRRQQKAQRGRAPRPARPGRGAPQRLLVTGGSLAGTSIGLADQQITIGRANDATLVLSDDY